MLKHATICRTSKAQQALTQNQWSRLEQQVTDNCRTDQVDGTQPTTPLINVGSFLSSSTRILSSSSCSSSPTPSSEKNPNQSSNLSSAPSSVFSSPSKYHPSKINGSQQQNHVPSTTTTTTKAADTTIKIFAQTLGQEVEYVTLQVNAQTKSKQIIKGLLKKFRLKHRDPNLYFLTLERWIRKDGLRVKSIMLLSDDACPLQLQQCCSNPPHNDIKFTLQVRAGTLMKIYCSDVCPTTRYKCLSLSTQTTVEETIELMLHCLNLYSTNSNTNNNLQTLSQCTSTTTKHDYNNNNLERQTQTDHHQHRQANSPGGTSSNSSSSLQSSSSSGIESDPTNQILNISSPLNRKLNLNSRASSITSISSSSNVSQNSLSISSLSCWLESYCLVIECKDTSYRRVLESDEFLVDVYQGLLDEARNVVVEEQQGLQPSFKSLRTTSSFSEKAENNNKSPNSSGDCTSEGHLIKQQPDQWFVLKLKRRDAISLHHLDLIRTTNPHKQSVPLPPIPQSLSLQFNNANELKNIVSTTQIEVNSRPAVHGSVPLSNCKGSLLRGEKLNHNGIEGNSCINLEHQSKQQLEASHTSSSSTAFFPSTKTTPSSHLVNDDSQLHYGNVQQIHQHYRQMSAICSRDSQKMPPPPSSLIWLPPVKPRKRNLSNASSTFQRPQPRNQAVLRASNTLTSSRRRYDPNQLAKDLSQLDLEAPTPLAPTIGAITVDETKTSNTQVFRLDNEDTRE